MKTSLTTSLYLLLLISVTIMFISIITANIYLLGLSELLAFPVCFILIRNNFKNNL